MSNSHEEIYAQNVHLFAFQLREGIDRNFQPFQVPNQWIADQYQVILKEFPDLNQPVILRDEIPNSSRFSLLEDGKQLLSSPLNPQTNKPYRRILLYPQQIADSYALALNIYIPQVSKKDEIKIEKLQKFNPNQCLEIETDLGKTLLLTAFLPNHESDKIDETAQKCLQSFLNLSSPEDCPPLYRKGQPFSSPIL